MIAVPAEQTLGEHRMTRTPNIAARFVKPGTSGIAESGAGLPAGFADGASRPADASASFARNLHNFIGADWDRADNCVVLPEAAELADAARLTDGGRMAHPRFAEAVAA